MRNACARACSLWVFWYLSTVYLLALPFNCFIAAFLSSKCGGCFNHFSFYFCPHATRRWPDLADNFELIINSGVCAAQLSVVTLLGWLHLGVHHPTDSLATGGQSALTAAVHVTTKAADAEARGFLPSPAVLFLAGEAVARQSSVKRKSVRQFDVAVHHSEHLVT